MTTPSDPRRVLRDPTVILDDQGRMETAEFRAAYPPLPADRSEYLATHADDAVPGMPIDVRVGSVIDGYRIKRLVGRGGMSVVYEAEQLALGRTVALKVMPPGLLSNSRAIDRFRREATAVARLHHPRIVAVHGFSIKEGFAYLAMEFVEGLDLAEIIDRLKTARTHGRRFVRISGADIDKDIGSWIAGRKLIGTMPGDPRIRDGIVIDLRNPFPMAAAIVADAADALRHAHAHGVIHRDVKPSNLILSAEGRIKLSDFGLAKSIDAGSLTETGDFVGSPAYVSPEQASSSRVRIDERTDVYSLGVTLYELLTLHQPFTGKNVAVILRQILTRDPPAPTRLNPRIPRDLETIVLKAIEKDREARYQSAEEFGDDLRRFLNFEPIAARPLGPVARVARALRNHRVTFALSSMGVLIVALAVVLATALQGNSQREADVSNILSVLGRHEVRDEDVREMTSMLRSADTDIARRAVVDDLVSAAQGRLADGTHDELARLLLLLDLGRAGLERWTETDRRLLQVNIRQIKIAYVRAVTARLDDPGLDAAEARRWLLSLERLLLDPDWQVCENAAVALASQAHVSSLGALLDALDRRPDSEGRVAVLRALAVFGNEDLVVERIAEELGHEDMWVRVAALEVLDAIDPPGLEQHLSRLAGEREEVVIFRLRLLRQSRLGAPR